MDFDKNCKWYKSCGADFCHGEGVCPDFEKRNRKGMKLFEQCKTCKANWDGHCINGNDNWKSRMNDKEVECEDYEESEVEEG